MEKIKKSGIGIGTAALILSLVFAGCATKGAHGDDSLSYNDLSKTIIVELAIPDEVFERVYEEHAPDIILTNARKYTVKSGDTLSKIALEMYVTARNAYFFPLIMLASRDIVKNPDLIIPGMVLTVPDLQLNLDDPKARVSTRLFLEHIADIYEEWHKYPQTQFRLRAVAKSIE